MTRYGRARTTQRRGLTQADPEQVQAAASRTFDAFSRHYHAICRFWDTRPDPYLRMLKTDLRMAREQAIRYFRQGYQPEDDQSIVPILQAFADRRKTV